jgi:hypothetical protein
MGGAFLRGEQRFQPLSIRLRIGLTKIDVLP